MSIDKNSRIFIAGHNGMVGSAILRRLEAEGYRNLLVASRRELDLTNQAAVNAWLA
ncbi:MAG: NAD-dependent epimerase/dehydratase family protein, partial [Pseudomonadales bacterium]|nr:NAD-dependent epimerase/dehydratase family protein [Pseudomonadales bacterium]